MINNKVHQYTKSERFAVVRKLEENRRYYCNFKFLHETKEAAETEAVRLANEGNGRYYVIEIQAITNGSKRKKKSGKTVEIVAENS